MGRKLELYDNQGNLISSEDTRSLEESKAEKIAFLREACQAEILRGFSSSALGSLHHYSGEYENQINLIGLEAKARRSGASFSHKISCTNLETGEKARRSHTQTQIFQVFEDGSVYKETQISRLESLMSEVQSATTNDAVDAISW